MPRKRGDYGMRQDEEIEATTTTEAIEYAEPTVTPEAHGSLRIVKLADAQTMWLVEDGVRHAFTCSADAAALNIAVEVVDEDTLRQWPQGDVYTP